MGFWRLHVPPAQKVADSVGRRRFIFAVVTKDVTTLIIYYYCSFDVRCSTECGDAYTTIQSRLTTSHPLTLFYTRLHTIWFLFMKTVGRFWFTNNYNFFFLCAKRSKSPINYPLSHSIFNLKYSQFCFNWLYFNVQFTWGSSFNTSAQHCSSAPLYLCYLLLFNLIYDH